MNNQKCEKCGYADSINKKFEFNLCDFCFYFSPNDKKEFDEYLNEKINFEDIETFRKNFHSRGLNQKKGMLKKFSSGKVMSRAPFGYKIENGKLIPAQNFREIEEIFEEFLNEDNLSKIAAKHNLSVNGLKKILKNYSYLGKVRFDGQIQQGEHQPIISSTLFNRVQDKLETLKIK